MTVGMSAPPMGMIIITPKISEMTIIAGIQLHVFGMQHQHHGDDDGDGEQAEVDEVLSFIGDGALRQDFLQFARGHQAAGEGERAEDDLERQHGHHELRNVGRAQVELRGADQRDAKRAEGVAERGPLRNGGHGDVAERHADDGAQHQRDGDPLVVDDALVEERADDGQQHAGFAGEDAAARGGGRAQPLERQDEQRRRNDVDDFNDVLTADEVCHGLGALLALNILSMRSVMMNPPTMLLVAATMAMVPRMVASWLFCSPARMMAPTTAMASSALVSDISGVCSSGETRRITSNPMNAASMKTYRLVIRSAFKSKPP